MKIDLVALERPEYINIRIKCFNLDLSCKNLKIQPNIY